MHELRKTAVDFNKDERVKNISAASTYIGENASAQTGKPEVTKLSSLFLLVTRARLGLYQVVGKKQPATSHLGCFDYGSQVYSQL